MNADVRLQVKEPKPATQGDLILSCPHKFTLKLNTTAWFKWGILESSALCIV